MEGKSSGGGGRKRIVQCAHGGIMMVGPTSLRHRRNEETAKLYQQEEGAGIRTCWSREQKRGDCQKSKKAMPEASGQEARQQRDSNPSEELGQLGLFLLVKL